MFCEKCGNALPEGARFCGSCGQKTDPAEVSAPTGNPTVTSGSMSATAAYAPSQPVYAPPVPPRPAYSPPPPSTYSPAQAHYGVEPLGVGSYIIMFIVTAIPLLNIIMLLVWSFGGNVNQNKKNFARATLILVVIGIVIWIIAMAALGSMLSGLMRGMM